MVGPRPSRRLFLAASLGAGLARAGGVDVCPLGLWEHVHGDRSLEGRLQPTVDRVMRQGTSALVVVHGGRIVLEAYADGVDPNQSERLYSISKSVTSALVGVALAEGAIESLETPIGVWLPQWRSGGREAITVRHLLTMTSGVAPSHAYIIPAGIDPYAYLSLLPMAAKPGESFVYDTQVFRLLYAILDRATGESLPDYAQSRLAGPLGMTSLEWETKNDGLPSYTFVGMSALDLARFGVMVARGGRWEGVEVVPEEYLRLALEPSTPGNPGYGWLWWLNGDGWISTRSVRVPGRRWPGAPADATAALGAFSKMLFVVPSRNLVVVRLGTLPLDPEAEIGEAQWENALLADVLAALPS